MLNADSFGGFTGELLSHNVYAYVQNNPVMLYDPSGYVAIGIGPEDFGAGAPTSTSNGVNKESVMYAIDVYLSYMPGPSLIVNGGKAAIGFVSKLFGKGINKANPEKVVNALSNFQSRKMTFGNQQFLLDKKGMKHILERHHPEYWNGTVKKSQTFLDKNLSVDDVANITQSVMKQNRGTLINRGTTGSYQISGTVNGVEYVVGLNKGRIGQLYSK
jgi:hypothetical protein